MKERINKQEEPLKKGDVVEGTHGDMKLIDDFLPSPADLVFKETKEKVKVTIELDAETLAFFKAEAEKQGSRYQPMVRQVLNWYVEQQKGRANLGT